MTVPAAHPWDTNADLIADGVAPLGYLHHDWLVLDPTYGEGTFWRRWLPQLVATDLVPAKSPSAPAGVDVRHLPYPDAWADAAVLDLPYKLNGTSAEDGDERYGVDVKASWQERHQLIRHGMTSCARVVRPAPLTSDRRRGGFLLVKCQDQVCSGAKRWQTIEFANHGATIGLVLVDRFDMLGTGREQPPRTRKDGKPSVQQHAHGHPSTLLVFRKAP